MTRGAYVTAFGFGLIAVCYGFARFAFGLLLPQIDAELSLPSTLTGLISGGSFLGYCVAIVMAAHWTERIGARAVAVLAALVAAIGMLGIAWAPSAIWLAVSVFLAGSSTGLASPPLAAAVSNCVRPERQAPANTFINAGTSAGVVLSGPIAWMMGGSWRWAFAIFAALAAAMALFAAASLPKRSERLTPSSKDLPGINGALKRLLAAAFLMGAASTAVWSFGGQIVSLHLGWSHAEISLLWIAIGAAGIVGSGAGAWTARFGIHRVHWASLIVLAAGILIVGLASQSALLTVGGGVLFGAAYITLTGVYLVWGVNALPKRPATGLTTGFLAIALGQACGAALFGYLASGLAMGWVVIVFATLGLTAGLASFGRSVQE